MSKRKKVKRTNNDLQNTAQEIKDRAKWTTLKHMDSGAPEALAVPFLHVTPVVVLLNETNIKKSINKT